MRVESATLAELFGRKYERYASESRFSCRGFLLTGSTRLISIAPCIFAIVNIERPSES